ncbi:MULTISPECIES: DUF5691 domain-containing protein [unclassified Crossiella]|uniref:DUF5691 domain-containing protein n=1 Tax=unclassified Crossiella TaxID=2620835 RepID=UPI001FFEF29B|nr:MULTISPECIES: DUF5691 domain-containing protein [unclassified Crossiella]MCK2236351.1 DUF5691 domain-containing protein [Crossiella sp. S99.2]MCK2250018.1 DUF5691 domain-containing protein [Crossiella sp. S99.1]
MSAWLETVQRLLVGATRSIVDSQELLADCAAFGLARHGAAQPRSGGIDLIAPAPEEGKPAAADRTAALLSQILVWEDAHLLTEWCLAVARAGKIAPPRALPDLLAAGTARTGCRPEIVEVLGGRGRWLAGMRPSWSWAAGTPETPDRLEDLNDLLDLPLPQRKAGLRWARLSDPAGVRQLIAAGWSGLWRAGDRRLLITALADGLSADDEPLLESALDDRAGAVHNEAVRLLRLLPGSALSQRSAARLRAGLHVSRDELTVREDGPYGTEPDPAEVRDLLREGTLESGVSGRLLGAASGVPPELFTELLGAGAERLLRGSPWAPMLLKGIAAALPRSADPLRWLPAVAKVLSQADLLDILSELPTDLAARALTGLVGRWNYDVLDHACSGLPGPWPAETTRAVLARYAEMSDRRWRPGYPPELLMRRGDLGVLTELWPRISQRWPEHGAEHSVLELRTELFRALDDRKDPA